MAVDIHPTSAISDAIVILGAVGLVIPAFAAVRISPVVGFILIGMLVGPYGLGGLGDETSLLRWITISNPETVSTYGEIGIVLLMFAIGLELSFDRLRVMRRLVFGLGTAQVLISGAVIAGGLAIATGMGGATALVIGAALALSSTAIVLPMLTAEQALVTWAGRASLGILLLQDLALIPLLFAISVVGGTETFDAADLAALAAKGAAAIALLLLAGRLLLRPALARAARTRSPEMFMAASLLIVIAASALTAAAGLSLVVGALLAGLIIADTEFRQQVEVTIEPFKGLLLGVFLISIGMGLNLERLAEAPIGFVAGAALLVAVKALIVFPLLRGFIGNHAGLARVSLLLGPGGEMSLIILSAAAAARMLSPTVAADAQLVTALAMTTLPLLSRLGTLVEDRRKRELTHLLPPAAEAEAPRVVVIGFGRVGRLVADMLERHSIPYLAVDSDVDEIARSRAKGRSVCYGDANNLDLVNRLELGLARALVVTMDEPRTVARIVKAARADHPDLQIIARARDARHAAELYRLGVTDAVPETVEASLQLSEAVLVDIGVPMGPVIASIHEKRADLREQIQALVPGLEAPPTLGRRTLREAKPKPGL
ncbi:cation:proton antiporter [Sphingoaurantiacus capsulatus]|uniref:Cation:proton antiporter n=1 Tax=Sphingoaurantiacus capsulatus TaxID=1771310 RepID=A0ABV7XEI5_9SPHN